jgi:DNA-binding NarL/FixJ family response regulator
LAASLNLRPDIRVVAMVASGTKIVQRVRLDRPDVAVLDIDLLGPGGLSAAAMIHNSEPLTRMHILDIDDYMGEQLDGDQSTRTVGSA